MSNSNNYSGFSLIELLITIATVAALCGIGLAVYAQYQQRAYNSTALQEAVQLRTAFEAGLSDRSNLGSTVFANNPALQFSIDGTLSCLSSCDDIDLNQLFPGFLGSAGVKVFFNLFDSTQSYQIQSGHCKALTSDGTNYDGWLVSDQQASARVAIPTDSDEISQCAAVLAGGALTTTAPTATATPGGGGGGGDVCGNSVCDSSETPCNCLQDCPRPSYSCGDGECTNYSDCGGPNNSYVELSYPPLSNVTYETFCPQDCGCSQSACGASAQCWVNMGGGNPSSGWTGDCTCALSGSSCIWDCSGCTPPPGCGDGNCDPDETCGSCNQDCACASGSSCTQAGPAYTCCQDANVCGNGTCDGAVTNPMYCNSYAAEDSSSCPQDCGGMAPFCGDFSCNGTELCSDCPGDCGACPFCGDGLCNNGESCESCPDCGSC